MTVLMLAREIEPQVDRVVEELAARNVPVFRTNLAAFPQKLTLDARLDPDGWNGLLATERRAVRLRAFDLSFGAFDFAVTTGGEWRVRRSLVAGLYAAGALPVAYRHAFKAVDRAS